MAMERVKLVLTTTLGKNNHLTNVSQGEQEDTIVFGYRGNKYRLRIEQFE